jgi:ribulose 1,5-bisphosphate synthetase/thiazole synthase
MAESEIALFDRIVNTAPPENPRLLFDTACVLGGSLAGLFAARVLAGHARQVVVIEQDEPGDGPRPGIPHGTQLHTVLAAGGL